MLQSAEFEAAVMERRVEIQALCAEARRLESALEDGSELQAGITVPAGWLAALAQGLAFLVRKWEREETDDRTAADASDTDFNAAELLERMRALASAIRGVEPDTAYTVNPSDCEALLRGIASALHIQEGELQMMSEHVDPPVLRFVAIEQLNALWRFYGVLDDLLERAEEP